MSLDDGLYLTSIYESLAVKYFSPTICCRSGSVARRQFLRSYALEMPKEDDIRVAGQGKFHPIYIKPHFGEWTNNKNLASLREISLFSSFGHYVVIFDMLNIYADIFTLYRPCVPCLYFST